MAGMLSAALGYTARGWVIHRIHPPTAHVKSPGKQPVDTGWQEVTEPPTKDKLGQWFENDTIHNIGLQCGERSGVTVIDLDSVAYADIFNGVDTLRSSRTAGRAHVYFRYNPRLKASKHHNLGIEVLATGNNAILPPSIHVSGDTYQWRDPDAELMEMPEEIEVKLTNLFEREQGLNRIIKKCRPCFAKLWKQEIRAIIDFHGAEGRELMVAWGTDLKAAGATLADADMWARVIYGDGYDPATTVTEWRGLDAAKTWRCETIAGKLGGVIECACEGCAWRAPAAPKDTPPPTNDLSPADRLIELGKLDTVFFHTPNDVCFAAVKLNSGGSAILPVTAKGKFAKILRQRYYQSTGKAPQPDVLKNTVDTLEAAAMTGGDVITLHTRVAERDGCICYDLTNPNFEAIEIRPGGWGVMPGGHILFKRHSHQIPQINPVPGGNAWGLFDYVNVSHANRLLVMVYLISCFVPDIAHVIPIITGEHGAAKTTASKLFKSLVDPSALDVISLPTGEDRFHQMLSHHWFVVFDNIDWIQRWQSDALCRASTGQATALRALYTDEDDFIFKYKMCVGLNGINSAATKPDLLDRAIFLTLDPIPDNQRMHEIELMNRFNAAKSGILGGIFDVLSKALVIYPDIHLDVLPRMADFALWGCAISEALGYTKEEFLDAYYENISQVNRLALEASPIGTAIIALMDGRTEWQGSPTTLLRELEWLAVGLYIDTKRKAWAKSPDALGHRMITVTPNLRRIGIGVERGKSGERNYRLYSLTYTKEVSKVSKVSTDSDNSQNLSVQSVRKCPDSGHVTPPNPDSGHFISDQKRQQADSPGQQDAYSEMKCPDSGHFDSDQNRQQADSSGHLAALDTIASTKLSAATEIMRLIGEHVQRYGTEDNQTFNLISARIEDAGYDLELVESCIQKYRQGQRVLIPSGEGSA